MKEMKKKYFVIVVVVTVLALVAVGWLYLARRQPPAPPSGIIENPQIITSESFSFTLPPGWSYKKLKKDVFSVTPRGAKGDIAISIDASGILGYRESLESLKAGLRDVLADSLLISGLLGQEVRGVKSDTQNRDVYVYASMLDNDGKLVTATFETYDRSGKLLDEYRIIRSSITMNNAKDASGELVKKDPEGKEIVPFFIRDGITAKHTFANGTHTVSGFIEFPNPCYTFEAKPQVMPGSPDFVLIQFAGSERVDVACIQVLTKKDFSVSFEAGEDSTIRASYNTLPTTLKFE